MNISLISKLYLSFAILVSFVFIFLSGDIFALTLNDSPHQIIFIWSMRGVMVILASLLFKVCYPRIKLYSSLLLFLSNTIFTMFIFYLGTFFISLNNLGPNSSYTWNEAIPLGPLAFPLWTYVNGLLAGIKILGTIAEMIGIILIIVSIIWIIIHSIFWFIVWRIAKNAKKY